MGSRGGSSGFLNGCRGRSHLDGDIQMEAWSRFKIFYVLHGEQTVEDKMKLTRLSEAQLRSQPAMGQWRPQSW